MTRQILWWLSDLAVLSLIVRGIWVGLFRRYFFFYLYILHVLALSIVRNYYYEAFGLGTYRYFYWKSQFVSVAWGYSVLLEMYHRSLSEFPGALRISRLLLGIFVPVLTISVIFLHGDNLATFMRNQATVIDLERYLRFFQALLLIVLVLAVWYFLVPVGKNLQGIILGYGVYIGFGVVNNTVRSLMGDAFQVWWGLLQQNSWLLALAIWYSSLWFKDPDQAWIHEKIGIRVE